MEAKANPPSVPFFIPAALPSGLPKNIYASSPTYVGPNNVNLLFPFTASNGVLEIKPINNFNVNSGILPGNLGATVTLSDNVKTVNAIGPNFTAYIKNCVWSGRTITDASTISVHTPAKVVYVQQLDETFIGHMSETAYNVTSAAPPRNFTLQFPGFGVTYAFLTPLVIKAKDNAGRFFYITFVTSFDK